MKNMITMMIGIVIGAITILIILTVTGRMNYATELESQLPAVVENILYNVKIKQLYNVADNQEFTADVTEQIAKELDAQTGIVMRIMGADKEKGLFSVGVDRTFVHPNGKMCIRDRQERDGIRKKEKRHLKNDFSFFKCLFWNHRLLIRCKRYGCYRG